MSSASTRTLARLPAHLAFTSPQLQKLSQFNICTTKDLLTRTELELIELCSWDSAFVRDVIKKIGEWVAPKSIKVADMLQKSAEYERTFQKTSLMTLNDALGGGLPCSTITEIVGPSGCGKTQFCLTLSVLIAHEGGGVVYIDTEGTFSSHRLVEIAQSLFPTTYMCSSTNLLTLINSIYIFSIRTSKDLIKCLDDLQPHFIKHKTRVLILDSIASLVRKDFSGDTGMSERSEWLVRIASKLKFLAESFRIQVVVTNQVVSRLGTSLGSDEVMSVRTRGMEGIGNEEEDIDQIVATAALGNTWAHSVTTRLVVEFGSIGKPESSRSDLPYASTRRRIRIAKSPMAPCFAVEYQIEAKGVVELNESV